MDSLQAALDEAVRLVEQARTMPVSSSALVHRGELLAVLERARALLPVALGQAQEVVDAREAVVEQGRREAARLVQQATEERARLVADSDVHREASAEAHRLVVEAQDRVAAMQVQVDDYVDGKLATFEVVLHRTLEAVERGRAKLAGRSDLDDLAGPGGPGLGDDPLPQ